MSTLVRACLAVAALAQAAASQCATWDTRFLQPGMDSAVRALVVYDDGSGDALYAGGAFTTAGGTAASFVAKWNGTSWSALGGGFNSPVDALAVFDDGSGSALYAGGSFTLASGAVAHYIARWNGVVWSPVGGGTNSYVESMRVFDDGSGAALYAAGYFTTAGGVNASKIAKWNGTAWSSVGGGLDDVALALQVLDDGSGPALYAGGYFTLAGGNVANHVARWNGSAWSALASGTNGAVYGLCAFDDGTGPAIIAGGAFSAADSASAANVARWNGSAWSALGSGTGGPVRALAVFDDGSGRRLYAGGSFASAGGASASEIAAWDGTSWSPRGGGTSDLVNALAAFDDGSGASLYVGGEFTTAGGTLVNRLARWSASGWSCVSAGEGMSGTVYALKTFDDGTSRSLYAGGNFDAAGSANTKGIARWNGSDWSPVAGGTDGAVFALEELDIGAGSVLVVGGGFTSAGTTDAHFVAAWDGARWSSLGGGTSAAVKALAVFDDGSGEALYAAGDFATAGGVPANRVARWNGSSWSPLGSGISGANAFVSALAVFDDGSGDALYAGGAFSAAGGIAASSIARWNGTSWSSVGTGVSGLAPYVYTLRVFDDGGGSALFAGGGFTIAGGLLVNRIAKWNGARWSALAGGVDAGGGTYPLVASLAVHDDGSGRALFVGGAFTTAGGTFANHLAKWNGSIWSAVSTGLGTSGTVYSLGAFDDGFDADADLYAGGDFTAIDGVLSARIAELHGCGTASFCFSDGVSIACPCANDGHLGHGCNNSANTGGAVIGASGVGSLAHDTVRFDVSGEDPNALSILVQGSLPVSPRPFGHGIVCVGGEMKRLYVEQAGGGAFHAPNGIEPRVHARSAALGDAIAAGSSRYYFAHYREQNALGGCPTASTFNATQSLRLIWGA
jgi:hypothetical protein